MKYKFTFVIKNWTGGYGSWHCEMTPEEIKELSGVDGLDDAAFDICADKLCEVYEELLDYSVDTVETIVTPIKLMSDENFELSQSLMG